MHIHQATVAQTSAQGISVSLTTEADELYYYQTWDYTIIGNVVMLNVYYVSGFGSTIAYLNNNFQIPIALPQEYVLYVKVFYTDASHSFRNLKDARRMGFSFSRNFPIRQAAVLRG